MKPNFAYTLRALACLLRYPDADLRAQMGELLSVFDAEKAMSNARRAELGRLIRRLQRDGLEAESAYVELFDRGRGTALHLFEHVHGDSRERGPAMVDLVKTYEQASLLLGPDELPDHLTVLLEFASTQPAAQARTFIGEFAHILQSIAATLQRRQSDYFAVLAAILEVAGQPALGAAPTIDAPMDESWLEPAAFGGCSTQGQSAPTVQPIHFHRQSSSTGTDR